MAHFLLDIAATRLGNKINRVLGLLYALIG